jgi:hypothetical protein
MDGLQAMERQMARSLRQLRKRKQRQEFAKSFFGQLYNIAGYCFAFYCGARLLMASLIPKRAN